MCLGGIFKVLDQEGGESKKDVGMSTTRLAKFWRVDNINKKKEDNRFTRELYTRIEAIEWK